VAEAVAPPWWIGELASGYVQEGNGVGALLIGGEGGYHRQEKR
jgi:hypothetical protein